MVRTRAHVPPAPCVRRRSIAAAIAAACVVSACGGGSSAISGGTVPATGPVTAPTTVPASSSPVPTVPVTAAATTAPPTSATPTTGATGVVPELPASFSVVVHERAVSTEYPVDAVPRPFEGWTTGDFDVANERAYLTRIGQAEPGDVVCTELLARDGEILARDTTPSTPDASFEPLDDEVAFGDLVAELDSIPIRFDDLRSLVPGAPGEGAIDVTLGAPDAGRLVEALSTMGIEATGFLSARIVASPTPDGLVGAATLTADGDGERFSSVVIEIAVTASDGRSSSVDESVTVAESGVCDPVATPVVGEWSIGFPTTTAPLGTLSITAEGGIAVRLPCYEGDGTASVGPFGLTDVAGLDAATGCGEIETELVRLLQGPVVLVAMVDGVSLLSTPSESEVFFTLVPA